MNVNLSLTATILVGLGSGLIGTLLTILLSPRLQHHFWTRQRRFELCMATIREIHALTGRMLFDLFGQTVKYQAKDPELTKAWFAVAFEAKNLFSYEAMRRFAFLDDLMVDLCDTIEKPTMSEDHYSELLDSFWDACKGALEALYADIGIRPKGFSWRQRLSWRFGDLLRKLTGRSIGIDEVIELVYPGQSPATKRRSIKKVAR